MKFAVRGQILYISAAPLKTASLLKPNFDVANSNTWLAGRLLIKSKYSTHALIDTICSEKAYQLGRMSDFSSIFSRIIFFRKFDKKYKIRAYQLGLTYCTKTFFLP